jgi:glycogen synthase
MVPSLLMIVWFYHVFYCAAAICRPDIVHAHDWPTAPVAFGDLGGACKSVFTIHNLNYGADLIGRAMGAAAACTTVSPTYAQEVRHRLLILITHFQIYLWVWWKIPVRSIQ